MDGIVMVPLASESSTMRVYGITYPPVAHIPCQRVHDGNEWL